MGKRLTPDVESVHYADVDEVGFPDEPTKSKKQMWSSGDRSKFWGQWQRKSPKPPQHVRSRVNHWLEYKDPDQAVTAINGYASLKLESMSIDEFQRGYWEYYKLGEAEERAPGPPSPPPPSLDTIQPQTTAPASPNAQHGAIQMWNELVPSNPVVWDCNRDNMSGLLKATQDPVFIEKLPEICAKAEALAKAGDKFRDFRWMIKLAYKRDIGNWWDFLHQKEAPRFKSQESLEDIKRNLMEKRFGSGKQ